MPLKYRWASGLLVIGAVGYALRLTALVLRDFTVIVIGNPGLFQRSRQQDTEKSAASTPSKGRQPKPDKIPATDQMPKNAASVAAQHQVRERPIGQQRGSSPKGAGAFSVHFWASKSEPVGDKTAPRAPAGPFEKPRGSGAKPPLKKQTAPLPHKETKAHTSSAVPLFLPQKTGPLKAVM